MVSVFSVKGLGERLEAIGRLADESGFVRHGKLGTLFLSFRPGAEKIIMIISGTHGVEGPAGYDLQLDLLQKKAHEKLPSDVGLVFVTALNPWGWVNGRRTNEDNVDLNRNGWFGLPPELPPLDPEINALVNPEECNEKWHRDLIACLADPAKIASLRAQVFRGQHDNC